MTKKVMVVDDSRTVRSLVTMVLTGAGFEVVHAVDGVDGLQQIEQHPDLALVLCDVNMPRMSGMEMLLSVKRGERNLGLPVVMLTTEGQPASIARARAAGAQGWIVKPFKPEALVSAVRRLTGS